ncbi:hypothetical protein L1987_72662 [Smallanthus sonchifolius]|uniref:Uncharacterized protein n=1 Tax=Smallanthus sonchifolius TaxID=185202 RepID=A0ACB9AW48_9ASTR|nr:hypothetical protein L1987_72662 [Smallanthus sonchifolius]
MSFLTTSDVTKLSILSKRLFFLWGSFPVIEFNQTRFSRRYQGTPASNTNVFLDHVLNSVLLRRINTVLTEFRVNANLKGMSVDHRFDLAILTVLTNGVRHMELNLGFAKYVLPTEFASKSITVLRLKGLQLDLCNLIQVCPLLRTLCLTSCVILQDIKFSSKTLTEIELHSCGVNFVKINVRIFTCFASMQVKKTLILVRLIDLSITKGAITDQWLEAQLPKMTSLERLRLEACNSLRKIKVCHEKLQILELYSCNGLVEVDIDTPQWRKMLSFFGHCKALKLICNTHKEVKIPELLRERLVSPLYDLQQLKIQIKSLEKINRDLVDGLLWLSPLPKTLHISSGSRSRLQMIIKFVYSDLIEEEEDKNPFCCVTKPIKCWKHHLKRLEIQSSDVSPKNGSSELQKYFLTNAKIPDPHCFSLGLK